MIGCIKIPQPCTKDYAFEFPVSVTPRDTFIVGDTIWWEVDIPNEILDRNSGAYIDITNFELFFEFSTEKLDSTIPITGNGVNHLFVFVEDKGQMVQRTSGLSYAYLLTTSIQEKHLRIGCIPTESGTYNGGFAFPILYHEKDAGFNNDHLEISDPNCRETITPYSKILVNNKDVNYHMMEGFCRYTLDGERRCYGPESELPMHSFYAFHVKEP